MKAKVLSKQIELQLTDGEMAELLQIARPTWNRIKNGHAAFTDDLAVRAVGVWPDLTRDLLDLAASFSDAALPYQGENPQRRVAASLQERTTKRVA